MTSCSPTCTHGCAATTPRPASRSISLGCRRPNRHDPREVQAPTCAEPQTLLPLQCRARIGAGRPNQARTRHCSSPSSCSSQRSLFVERPLFHPWVSCFVQGGPAPPPLSPPKIPTKKQSLQKPIEPETSITQHMYMCSGICLCVYTYLCYDCDRYYDTL